MTRAILSTNPGLFLLLVAGCNPDLARDEGSLRVIAHGLPAETAHLDLVLTRGGEDQRLRFTAGAGDLELSVDGLPVGALAVRAEAMGGGDVLLATRTLEANIQAGITSSLVFEFGPAGDAGPADGGETIVRSGRILHTFRLREDAVSAGTLSGIEIGNGPAMAAFWTLAEAQLGEVPRQLSATEVDLTLTSASGVTQLAQIFSEVTLVLRGLDTNTEVTVGSVTLSGTPTRVVLMPTRADLLGLRPELSLGRFEVLVRGSTPQDGQLDFEVFLESGLVLSASL